MNVKRLYTYLLIEGTDLEELKTELENKGLEDIFIIEDDSTGETLIGGTSKRPILTKKALLVKEESAVNWEEQWAQFAEGFKEGKAHIDLSPFGTPKTLLLQPGPGFGDLSHPTTYLMLEMMQDKVQNLPVLDIGCGSGILALAALLLGASSAHGIDIDSAAIKHAGENALLNHLPAKFSKTVPKRLPKNQVCLLNMIFQEQQALNPKQFNEKAKLWIVSGILKTQRKAYLKEAADFGWKVLSEYERDSWLGWVFT